MFLLFRKEKGKGDSLNSAVEERGKKKGERGRG